MTLAFRVKCGRSHFDNINNNQMLGMSTLDIRRVTH